MAKEMSTIMINFMDITEDNIVDCKILDNGNYYITSVMTLDDIIPLLIEVEMTADGYLLSHVSNAIMSDDSETEPYILITNVQYKYGVLTDSDVQANIDAYVEQESNN